MKRLILLVIAMMLALGLAATGCGDEEGGDSQSAADLLDEAWTKMSETEAVHEEFDMTLTVEGDLSDVDEQMAALLPMTMGISGSADLDMSDEEDIKADVEIELDVEEMIDALTESMGDELTSEDAMGLSMAAGMFADIKVRVVDQTVYVELAGEWYEMPLDESGLEDITGGVSPVDVNAEDVDAQCIQDELTLSSLLTNIEDKGKEDIDGTETTHISASLDTAGMVDKIVEVNDKCGGEEMDDEEIADARDILEEMITKADMEFWIDGDKNIRKVTIDMEMDLAAAAESAGGMMDEDTAGSLESLVVKMQMTLEMSAFGEAVSVEAPADAMPIEDLLGGFGGLGGLDSSGGTDDLEGLEDLEDFGLTEEELQQLEDELGTLTTP